jgi:HTH-type transcriptional regulator / antitoxin HipB
MQDTITSLAALGEAVRALRQASALSTLQIARHSGRSRDVLNRLERGQDVSVSSLLNILAALGHGLALPPAGRPSLQAMRRRFAELDHEPVDGAHDDEAARR